MEAGLLWTVVGSAAGIAAVAVGIWQGWLQIRGHKASRTDPEAADAHAPPTAASVQAPIGRLPTEVRGRRALLKDLRRRQRRGGVVVLAGMGGVGKSTVAAELARQALAVGRWRRTPAVWWISAADATSLTAGLVAIARRLGASPADLRAIGNQAPDGPDRLWVLLERAQPKWLLVVDNADDPRLLAGPSIRSADVRSWPATDGNGWIRHNRRGLVVITSRRTDAEAWGRRTTVHRLAPLGEADAARVLLDLAPSGGNKGQAAALGLRLGGLPLALHLAGSYLGSEVARWPSFDAYRHELDRVPAAAHLLTPDPDTERADDKRALIMLTWETSLDDLAERGLPEARAVLRLLSCYASAVPIPVDLIALDQLGTIMPASGDRGMVAMRLDASLRGLARLGLIDAQLRTEDRVLVVHPVIADTNRAHLIAPIASHDTDAAAIRSAAVNMLAAAIGKLRPDRPADWPRFHMLTPHIQALLETSAAYVTKADLSVLMLTAGAAAHGNHRSGTVGAAASLIHAALAQSARLGPDNQATFAARNQLAMEAHREGRWADAEVTLREVLASERRALGENHPETLATRHWLARAIAAQDRWEEAEADFKEILDARQMILGRDHPDTLATRHRLARAIASQGRWDEAAAAFRDVLDARVRILGADHPSTLSTRHRLATITGWQGRWAEAEADFREILETRQRVLGRDHINTLSTRRRLGWIIALQGRWREAETVYRAVLEAQRAAFGDSHVEALLTADGIAWVLGGQRRWAEAEAAYRQTILARRRVLGDDHPYTLYSQHGLATVLVERGRLDEARALLEQVLEVRRKVRGERHPDVPFTERTVEELRRISQPPPGRSTW